MLLLSRIHCVVSCLSSLGQDAPSLPRISALEISQGERALPGESHPELVTAKRPNEHTGQVGEMTFEISLEREV